MRDILIYISPYVDLISALGIYGVAALAFITYLMLLVARKIVRCTPNPATGAMIVGILALVIVPSLPRYTFEAESRELVSDRPWVRIISQTKWGDITEPLTWFFAPVGHFTLAMPNEPSLGEFKEMVLRYGEDTQIFLVEPDCKDGIVDVAVPDSEGIYRYVTQNGRKMADFEYEAYCQYDWTLEREALNREMMMTLPSSR